MFDTLAREGVNIEMISTSEIKVSVVTALAKGEQAMRAVHAAFLGS
jgi:aspartate kinase